MQHFSELRAQTIEKAAYYLDVALNMRNSSPESHMLYTLNVYQYTVPTGSSAGNIYYKYFFFFFTANQKLSDDILFWTIVKMPFYENYTC